MKLVVAATALLIVVACGDGQQPSGTGGEEAAAACPPTAPGQFSGPTSEDLCVTLERDASGDLSSFELEVMAECTLGFGEGAVTLTGEGETITSSEASFDAGQPFVARVTIEPPIQVEADGSFASGNLSGTITDTAAEGSYELDFTGALLEDFSCSGGPITWNATQGQ